MFRTSRLCALGMICLAVILPASAFAGHHHPGYQHAMDDLRLALALLQRPAGAQAVNKSPDEVSLTITDIEGAVKEISEEVGPDLGKTHETPRFDARMPWKDRLVQSLRLLERAELEYGKEKGSDGKAGSKAKAFDLLDEAHTRISVAIQTVNFDYSARNVPTRND
jgi:hypothetical protein